MAAKKAALETAKYGVKAIKQTIRTSVPKPIATREYIEGWKVRETPMSAVIENDYKQAYFIEEGRAPGPAPMAPFLVWARAKLHSNSLGGMTAERLAFLAHRKVTNHGYEARHIVRRTMPKIKMQLQREIRHQMRGLGSKAVKVSRGGYLRVMKNSGYSGGSND